MDRVTEVLAAAPLFEGIGGMQIQEMMGCFRASIRTFKKHTVIYSAGETVGEVGIVISGRVDMVFEDAFGSRSLIDSAEAGQMFGDTFVCSTSAVAPVDVVAAVDTETLMIGVKPIFHTCAKACEKHQTLIENMVRILADKYLDLNGKVLHLSKRTIRRKLLSYLSSQALQANSSSFVIPFNQQELADYLFVERSGLSVELNRLKREGIIDFEKNRFRLNVDALEEE